MQTLNFIFIYQLINLSMIANQLQIQLKKPYKWIYPKKKHYRLLFKHNQSKCEPYH